ncbi:chemotaxis response regulator protein-glutamate methylesterase [Thiospirochaeta perfilievii]|uniref:Protein-glutamate methylesterase/protein-glutamine glutaminase n=1 Tax=Thiospirochaeta perfilievii TaxID=252967 RepID=A0A5C1QCI8_9SPIO|nr:chemotaxis response regulator protein-glutamate methylesterase [Thiospirochaeta perfilievii]QEN04820.1 chemotaxis response regulator protein-glutamate methylesterase [Thiospirochaeta perfilievii]
MNKISVMVVDDSVLMRKLIGKILEDDLDIEVVAKAMNGKFALSKMKTHEPDIIILDLEMPEMDGITFLKEKHKLNNNIPVIILSSIATKGAAITMEALSLGASDFVTKPSGSVSLDISDIGEKLKSLVKAYGRDYVRRHKTTRATAVENIRPSFSSSSEPKASISTSSDDWEKITPISKPGKFELLAIGISTGGPNALRKVFAMIPEDFPLPIVVVQHMPAGFTKEFAKGLDRISSLEVKEAEDGDLIKKGRILIAPGDRHIKVEKKSLGGVIRLDDSALVSGHKPSADVLFESVAANYGKNAIAVIMTGMGKDGAKKIGEVYRAGGYTLGQNQESCVVYGMPKVAFEHGYIHEQFSLIDLPSKLEALVTSGA